MVIKRAFSVCRFVVLHLRPELILFFINWYWSSNVCNVVSGEPRAVSSRTHNMSHLAKRLGKNIKIFRIERDLNQEALAFSANLDRSYLSKVENGAVKLSVLKLYDIAEALDCTPQELLPSTKQMEQSLNESSAL